MDRTHTFLALQVALAFLTLTLYAQADRGKPMFDQDLLRLASCSVLTSPFSGIYWVCRNTWRGNGSARLCKLSLCPLHDTAHQGRGLTKFSLRSPCDSSFEGISPLCRRIYKLSLFKECSSSPCRHMMLRCRGGEKSVIRKPQRSTALSQLGNSHIRLGFTWTNDNRTMTVKAHTTFLQSPPSCNQLLATTTFLQPPPS